MPRGELELARERKELMTRIERQKELFGWGDISREQYRAQKAELESKLQRLRRPPIGKARSGKRRRSCASSIAHGNSRLPNSETSWRAFTSITSKSTFAPSV